jgi:hypothetical protein
MDSENKCAALVNEICKILDKGITLSSEVIDYIDSTFSDPTISELQSILQDDSNCEKDSLMELLFFPDESMQMQLEELLESLQTSESDEQKVTDALTREPPQVTIRSPAKKGSLHLAMPREVIPGFVSRLRISKHLEKRLCESLNTFTDEEVRRQCKVKIRNSRFSIGEKKVHFLCDFFEKIAPQSHDFNVCLDFTLSLLDEISEDKSIYQALMDKKKFYLRSLQKARQLEMQLQKSNLETLLLEGKRVILIDQDDARKKMLIIDRISRAVYGKTEFFEQLDSDEEHLEIRSDQDIQDIMRRLS